MGVDSRNVDFIEKDSNNIIRLDVYTAYLLATPLNVHVRQMPLDLDNVPPGVVLLIGKKLMILSVSWLTLIPAPP